MRSSVSVGGGGSSGGGCGGGDDISLLSSMDLEWGKQRSTSPLFGKKNILFCLENILLCGPKRAGVEEVIWGVLELESI
jgi:hypothetical protein